jgi:hypothetical protein
MSVAGPDRAAHTGRLRALGAGIAVVAVAASAAAAPSTSKRVLSVFSAVTGPVCVTVKDDKEKGSQVQRCPGPPGYQLLVTTEGAGMSVAEVTPEGREHPLDYRPLVPRSLSTLGGKAEWRVITRDRRVTPIALILRVLPSDERDADKQADTSHLVVAKITPAEVCVTATIPPAPEANARARRAADQAADRPCLAAPVTPPTPSSERKGDR